MGPRRCAGCSTASLMSINPKSAVNELCRRQMDDAQNDDIGAIIFALSRHPGDAISFVTLSYLPASKPCPSSNS